MPRTFTRAALVEGVEQGDRRAIARALTLVENGDPVAYELVRELYPHTGRAYSVGVTGPPGVGKSSLVAALVALLRAREQTVGVISVDPTSPFTKGAGLAEATLQAALILDASGKNVLFLETVGIGQSELEIAQVADTVLLVLMPGSGDAVQALKAGIMEIPDVIAINKCDHPLARTLLQEVRGVLALTPDRDWVAPIVLTEALRPEGVDKLWDAIESHRAFLAEEGRLEERRRRKLAAEVFSLASGRAKEHLARAVADDPELRRVLDAVERRDLDPLTAVREIVERVFQLPS
jgi:LAO/AO transport system kinase